MPPSSEALYCKRCTAHCHWVVWRCISRDPLFRQRSSWAGLAVPLARGPVHCRSSTAHRPQCMTGVPLPTTAKQCGSA